MPEPEQTITNCGTCGNAMNVTAVAPFSNVECPTCGAKERVKTEFGHYTLTRRLAEGGMSLVFVAMDNTLGREVALKILNEAYSADEKRIAAFEEEARITASFSHPHVVRVFTTGRAFDRFYIAMELVPGGHFEHQIRERGKIPEAEILPFAVQVAEGLEAARAAGLIHRDIKPGNILLDAQGNAKIVDFGLALLTKDGSATAQEIWATPYYVPPETIEGHPEDFRSDLYAFGATLYHALAGKPPCDEETMATDKLREAKKHIRSLRTAAADVTDDTCAIVDKAMAYAREARFSSYEEMISQLKVAQSRLKKGRSRTGATRAAARKKEWIAIGAAATVVLAAVVAGVVWVLREEPVIKQEESVIAAQEITEGNAGNTAIGQLYREARQAMENRKYPEAAQIFVALREDDEVQEPTRSWAGVEAAVATFLDGRNEAARKEARLAAAHIGKTELAEQRSGDRLVRTLAKLDVIEPMEPFAPAEPDAAWALTMILGGLKNWEQGLTDSAAKDFFDPLAQARFKPKDQWVQIYQKISKDYLEDHRLLSDKVFASIPTEKSACLAAISTCEKLLPAVKTQGRTRFNIRAFQLDLRRQIALLEAVPDKAPEVAETAPAVSDSSADPMLKFQELTKACRFRETADFLKALTADPPGAKRDALLEINALAIDFLEFLEQEISGSFQPVQLRLRTGEAIDQVKITAPGQLSGIAPGGQSGQYGWGDIDPGSAVQFYRTTYSRSRTAETEKLQPRHETAIAYDWLVGDRARATAAADRLSLDNETFRKRWETLVAGLPKG
ncbi:serine/threonine-protein kinase [Luteolibacter sp. SL250]|uniref:serine/threonine-protein kinase n=1 Tax=Luteolibacter sp. SL250 TaxID=2995170 RepID=UPI00226E33D1|nr:serine/threonine-protein kinase [Luteolibacter sp. SL250]WAC18096.1 serine/threonine-protein kinase [Luteolibacter sp. SL250]